MRRRIILIVVVALMLAGIGGGIAWYVHRNRGAKLLARVELAMKAQNFDRAESLARDYIASQPKDWRGHFMLGQALHLQGKYEDKKDGPPGARTVLKRAEDLAPASDKVDIVLWRARTFTAPAERALSSPDAWRNPDILTAAKKGYRDANDLLSGFETDDEGAALDLAESRGANQARIAEIWSRLRYVYWREGSTAEAARDLATRDTKWKLADEAWAERQKAYEEASETLLEEVVKNDPTRAVAAAKLVEVCRELRDRESLAAVREAIESCETPPVLAYAMLLQDDLTGSTAGRAASRPGFKQALARLDDLLAGNPKEHNARMIRAELALTLGDLGKADELCNQVLAADAGADVQTEARFVLAQVMMSRKQWEQAENALSDLKSRADISRWRMVHCAYGVAANKAGHRESAREAWRSVLLAIPGDVHAARMMIDSLLGKDPQMPGWPEEPKPTTQPGGLPSQAFSEARACYEANRANRAAMELLVKTAEDTGQEQAAIKVFDETLAKYPGRKDGLWTASIGFEQLGERESAREALRKLLLADPGNVQAAGRLIGSLIGDGLSDQTFDVARACYEADRANRQAMQLLVQTARYSGQQEAASKVLDETVAKFPDGLVVLGVAAEGYEALGERAGLLAARRRIVEIAPKTTQEKLIVAGAMANLGRTSEAETLLAEVATSQPDLPAVPFEQGRVYVTTRRPMQAAEKFQEAIRLDPANLDYRLALARVHYGLGMLDDARSECQQVLERSPDNDAALLLLTQIKTAQGESISSEELLRRSASQSGLPLARTMLALGQPDKCVELCQAELAKDRDNPNALNLLGGAYLALGRRDDCTREWAALLKAQPDQLASYLRLADVLAATGQPADVQKALAALPGAKSEMIDLAVGRLLVQRQEYAQAADLFSRVADQAAAPPGMRQQARLARAQALAAAGQVDQAAAELDRLADEPAWATLARLNKASLLIVAKRAGEAEPLLAEIVRQAEEKKNASTLYAAAQLLARAGQPVKALAVAESICELQPAESRGYLLAGAVLIGAGRLDEAVSWYQKARRRQPGNTTISAALVGLLDNLNRPTEVLAVLNDLPELGEYGKTQSLFQKGTVLSRWGLPGQALVCFEELAKSGYQNDPRLQLFLGQAFARLGEPARARESLAEVPPYAAQYVSARQIMVELAGSPDEKLALLDELDRVRPGLVNVLAQRMAVLAGADRPADAVKAFNAYRAGPGKDRPVPPTLAGIALGAMLSAGDQAAAGELAAGLAVQPGGERWRATAILLMADAKPQAAIALLPEPAKIDLITTLLGVALSTGDDKAKWSGRLTELSEQAAGATPPRTIPAGYRLLAELAVGDVKAAADRLAGMNASNSSALDRATAVALVASVRAKPATAADADVLIKASLAAEVGLRPLAKRWAADLLKARPTCQWAAALVMQTEPDPAARKVALAPIQPPDCLLARLAGAAGLMADKKYAEAADAFAQAAQAADYDPDLLMNQGMALEAGGRFDQALAVYRQVWARTKNPVAANNAAYLVSQRSAQDATQLAEVDVWLTEAIKAAPNQPAFLDTRGWILHLRGEQEKALTDLRQAVKRLPDSPEVHYHVAVVEQAAGNTELARWHAEAAVAIGKAYEKQGRTPVPSAADAIRAAAELLDKLAPPAGT